MVQYMERLEVWGSGSKKSDWLSKGKEKGSDMLLPVLQWWVPKIGEKIDSIDLDKQFSAVLATSRLQKDYEMAENLVKMVDQNKKSEAYDVMLAVALLNQAQLFEFRKPIKKKFSSDEDERDLALRKDIQAHLTTSVHVWENEVIQSAFGEAYKTILADFAIVTKKMGLIHECLWLTGDKRLEKAYMENIVEASTTAMVDQVFVQLPPLYYAEFSTLVELEWDPDICFDKVISSLTTGYLSDPLFTLEWHNQTARKQIWRYHILWWVMRGALDETSHVSQVDFDDLKEFFDEQDVRKDTEVLFKTLLEKDLDQASAKKEIVSWLTKIIDDHQDLLEE